MLSAFIRNQIQDAEFLGKFYLRDIYGFLLTFRLTDDDPNAIGIKSLFVKGGT